MHYAGSRRSKTNPLASIPLFRSAAAIMRPFEPLPVSSGPVSFPAHYRPATDQEQRRRELANAEAALAGLVNALAVARAGIGEANRTSTTPVMPGNRVLMPARRYSPERLRERKSYAFTLFNKRRGQVAAARRRVDAARAALGMPTLAHIEERAATKAAIRASKRGPVSPIASGATA